MLDTPLRQLELSVRAFNCLKNEGFNTIGDVLKCDEPELLRIPNFGRKSLNEFNELVAPFGLRVVPKTKRHLALSTSSDVFEAIKVRALANNRSVEAEAASILVEALGATTTKPDIFSRLNLLERAVFGDSQEGA